MRLNRRPPSLERQAGSYIRVTASYTNGELSTPKSGKVRSVPMAPEVGEALARLRQRDTFTGPDELMFVGLASGHLDAWALLRRYRAALRAAGLRPLRFHDVRHTFGTRVIGHTTQRAARVADDQIRLNALKRRRRQPPAISADAEAENTSVVASPLFSLADVSVARFGRPVLTGLTMRIEVGSTAVLGPSGAGKSTLLRVLNRLAEPDRGIIHFGGRRLVEYDVLELRRTVALVPQLPALVDGTAEDNIAFAARLAARDVDVGQVLEASGLGADFGERDCSRLSVGEQQRVMLARALAQAPRVLLLDEPTSALDEASRDAVERTLQDLRARQDLSLVVVTHDREQAERLAERVVRLEAGRALEAADAAVRGRP
jgi:putative ABC transport system ATP-binding protein